jgi:hypothetical protein
MANAMLVGAVLAAALTAAGCASASPEQRPAVDHILVRVAPDLGGVALPAGQHSIEMRYLSGAGWVQADGTPTLVDRDRDLRGEGAVVAHRIEFGPEFATVAHQAAFATDGQDTALTFLSSRKPLPPEDALGVFDDAVFRDLHGRVMVASTGAGALDLTLTFVKEELSPWAEAKGLLVPDTQVRRMTLHLTDGQSALIPTAILGEVRLR